MKFAIAAILATTFAMTSNATSIRRYRGTVESSILVKNSEIAFEHAERLTSGSVTINYDKGVVNLSFTSLLPNRCLPGKICPAVMIAPKVREVTLPIVNMRADACGILTITALEDNRPADGIYQEINVQDITKELRCTYVRAPDVRATYKTINPWNNRIVISKMYLKVLRKAK